MQPINMLHEKLLCDVQGPVNTPGVNFTFYTMAYRVGIPSRLFTSKTL